MLGVLISVDGRREDGVDGRATPPATTESEERARLSAARTLGSGVSAMR